MKFKHKLYHYQKDVLDVFEKELSRGDKKIHIVSPPGSGKTIMGLEMISRIKGNHLILVPNLTLQYQWKDKIEQFFLEEGENIDDIVSTDINEVKNINIITYQGLTSSNRDNDLIIEKIYERWYTDIKDEFKSRKEFNNYIEILKDIDIEEYKEKVSKYKKKIKTSNEDLVEKILSKRVLDYFNNLKKNNIKTITVDEAHHLTSWWSKVLFYLWEYLSSPLIIGLTATPPYDDIDFFTLDDDYSKLLGEVDYYIPTPAVVKSARLAPWSDLVYFVEPGDDLKITLEKTDKKLDDFIIKNYSSIIDYIFLYVEKNYDSMINKSYIRLINYLKFIRTYSKKDISKYFFDEKISDEILLEDIAKTVGEYLSELETKKTSIVNNKIIKDTKKLFYELGYIWRANNFYKFRTRIENMLIYSKSKINGIKIILDKEKNNLGSKLKCAIITDFLEDRDGIINCKFILKELIEYKDLNPILLSGQGIRKLSQIGELEELNTNILEVTRDLENGKINLVIGTRGILGEGWDCPGLNTLIDLTGIVAYMSVNQVRGRAIRLDKTNINKVANIYDIVTYYEGYTKEIDLYRLERKHEKFYGVDDTGLIIRGVDHIYPNIRKNIIKYEEINKNMLKRSTMREYYFKLWNIGGNYQNKEVFGLDLEIKDYGKFIPFVYFNPQDIFYFISFLNNKNLDKLGSNNFYNTLIYRFLKDFLLGIIETEIELGSLPNGFDINIIKGQNGNYKVTSDYKDELVIKRFINNINQLFSPIVDQKYILQYPFAYFDGSDIKKENVYFGLPNNLCNNKKIRLTLYKKIKFNFLKMSFLTNGMIFGYIFNIFKSMQLIYFYKNIYMDRQINYIYIKAKDTDKKKHIGNRPFIESKIEKIWL